MLEGGVQFCDYKHCDHGIDMRCKGKVLSATYYRQGTKEKKMFLVPVFTKLGRSSSILCIFPIEILFINC